MSCLCCVSAPVFVCPAPSPAPAPGRSTAGGGAARTRAAPQVEKELAGINARLNNPGFVEKAKPEVLEEVRTLAAQNSEKLALIEQKLAQVAALQPQ